MSLPLPAKPTAIWPTVGVIALIGLVSSPIALYAIDASRGTPGQEIDQERLAEAIYVAEGGVKARKPFGILSVPCEGYTECRRICLNTIRNRYRTYLTEPVYLRKQHTFIEYLGLTYAPPSAHPLNCHWAANVQAIYDRLEAR